MLKTEGYENSQLFMALTPKNGVKASKLYSYKPIDGTGDFHWSRNHTAYRLNQEGVLELMGNNVPRVDYTNTCPELLIEKESENLLLRSQEFDNASWSKPNINITSNNINAPDLTLTADKFQAIAGVNISPNVFTTNPITINLSKIYTFSFYAKKGSTNFIQLRMSGLPFANANPTRYNLNTGLVVSGTGNIEEIGDGWYRLTQTEIPDIGAINTDGFFAIDLPNASNDWPSANFNGTESVYIWGAQLEESEYATSYIPTTNTTQTRPQDICYNTANGYGDAQFSVVTRIRLNNVGTSTFEPLLTLSDGTSDIYLCIYTDGNNKLYFDWFNIAPQFVYDTASFANGIVNIGLSYNDSTGDYIIVINGTLEDSGNVGVSIAGAFTGTINRLDLGSLAGGGSPDGDRIIGVQYYNTALTQSDLENLTS